MLFSYCLNKRPFSCPFFPFIYFCVSVRSSNLSYSQSAVKKFHRHFKGDPSSLFMMSVCNCLKTILICVCISSHAIVIHALTANWASSRGVIDPVTGQIHDLGVKEHCHHWQSKTILWSSRTAVPFVLHMLSNASGFHESSISWSVLCSWKAWNKWVIRSSLNYASLTEYPSFLFIYCI